jgi:O-antigen/teichoic acid export membrane protein
MIYFIGTLSISFFNYLYYPILGRLLSVEYYGEVQALISLYLQISIFLVVFGYITVNVINNHSKEEEKVLIITELERMALFLTGISFLLILLFASEAKTTLKFTTVYPFLALAPLVLITVPFTFRNYFLQGHRKLKEVSLAGIIYSLGKLMLAILFILLGMKSLGAMVGYILAMGLGLIYVYVKTKNDLPITRLKIPVLLYGKKYDKDKKLIKDQLFFGFFVFFALLSVTFLYTYDAVIVRKYFDPTASGLFSGISTIARIIYFGTASVAGVLLASVSLKSSDKDNRKLLIRSLGMIAFLGLSGLAIFSLFPKLIITILLGSRYQSFANLLPIMSLSMLLASITNLIVTYQIALRRYLMIVPAALGGSALFLLSSLNHGTLLNIAYNFIYANVIALAASIIIVIFEENAKKDLDRSSSL